MLDSMVALVGRTRNWLSRVRSHPGYRLLVGATSLGVLAASIWFIWKQLSSGYATVSTADLDLEPRRLIVSWICITTATALGAWEWVLLVRALGGQLDLVQGMSVHLTSNLAKYVPGFIWSYAGKGYLAVRRGVPAAVVTLSIGGEFAIVYICGALLILLALPFSGLIPLSAGGRVALQVVGIGAAGLLILGLPPLARRWSLRNRSAPALLEPLFNTDWSRIAFVVLAVLMTWFLLNLDMASLLLLSSFSFVSLSCLRWGLTVV